MKKILLVVGLVAGSMALTGCGTETLTCTKEEKTGDITTTSEIKATFEGDKAKTVEASSTAKYPDSYKSQMDKIKSMAESMLGSNADEEGVDFNITTKGTSLTYTLTYDIDKLSDEEKSNVGFDANTDQSKEVAQKSLEKQGYTCK